MSNLTNNTTALQALLEQAHALPDAGGVSSLETCTVNINDDMFVLKSMIYVTDEGVVETNAPRGSFDVVKGAVIWVTSGYTPYFIDTSDTFELLTDEATYGKAAFRFTGDGSVSAVF